MESYVIRKARDGSYSVWHLSRWVDSFPDYESAKRFVATR